MAVEQTEKIVPRVIEDELKQSYLGYSMSVIVGRALPDVRDGLKPVHRRVLYSMQQMGLTHNKPFKKAARIVGDCLGKFHPHGDTAVYDSLVRMTQDFSLRYPLVQGQGNFGSVDGDAPAAMRYTEARLNKLSEEMLQDLDKDTVDFAPNFDGSLEEPTVLPSKAPSLLLNGSSGIAVGMATNIPPHNMREICDGIISTIDNSDITAEQLMQIVKGPDFPTGGIIYSNNGLREAYTTGRGKIMVRAKTEIEEVKNKQRIIVTEIPYMVNKALLIESIANLVRDKKITGISDLRDESDREGMRIVIELRSGANSDVVLNQLFAHTRLQETFGIISLALVENQPKILTLKNLISEYIKHRRTVVRRRTQFELNQAEAKAHILEGLIVALDNLDPVISFIRKATSPEEARTGLMEDYQLTQKQAQAILDMRLQRLTNLEQEKVRTDHKQTLELIAELKSLLASEQRILNVIKDELTALKDEYGDDRRTQIIMGEVSAIETEQLIKPEEVAITITHAGYVKRLPVDTYKKQRRGGKGIVGTGMKAEDFVEDVFIANTHDYLLCFTNKGKIHWLKVYQIPEAGRYARGTPIVNILEISKEEKITTYVPIKEFDPNKFVFMATKRGTVKKTSLADFSNPRKGGIIALDLVEGDELIGIIITNGKNELILATAGGMAVHFHERDVRAMGRTARGVIGIRLKKGDSVIGCTTCDEKHLLTITEKGYGKRTPISEYRLTSRGGVGVKNINITEKNGNVVEIKRVSGEDELLIITNSGILMRTPVKGISVIGRATQGVRVIRIDPDDSVRGVAVVHEHEQ